MRKALYQYLTANCQSVKTWKQPYQADASTPKPYGVILFGERPRSPFNRRGVFQDVTIWVYFQPGSYLLVDAAVAEIKALLSGPNGTGKVLTTEDGRDFLIEWNQDGRDFHDDVLQALAKRIDFTIPLGG
ncbi:MAG: hypothetical protein HPY52_10790 [Firmicutes bacterium]|nr:hypothetical protein [Bacillota bacterium]